MRSFMVFTSHDQLGDTERKTGFRLEEMAVALSERGAIRLEIELKAQGAPYSKSGPWHPYAVTDGMLITGHNPASSECVAKAVLAQRGG